MSPKLCIYVMLMGVFSLSAPAFAQNPFAASPNTSLADPASPANDHTLAAHVHGVAHLAVAVDAQVLVMDLEVPLVNLVGFEHTPANDTERDAFAQAARTLKQADNLFKFNASAKCAATSVQVDMPTFEHGTHDDVDARYGYTCQSMADLHSLEVTLFEHFGDIETLKATYIDDDTQIAQTLSHDHPALSLR